MIAEGRITRLLQRADWRRRPHVHAGPRRRGRVALSRRSRLTLAVLAAVAVLLAGGWLWVRDSSLVAVRHVRVTGVSGPDAGRIRTALIAAARNMTTLDVKVGQLRTAVAPYPIVKDVRVNTSFPHGMRIEVVEQIPVAVLDVGAQRLAVAGDGTLLRDVTAPSSLPVIPLRVPPGGSMVSDPFARAAVRLLAAAPYALLASVSQVAMVAPHGLVAQIRGGPSIYFGDSSRLAAKWVAASAVLADGGSAGAVYIDVTDPARPAAGAGGDGASAASTTASASTSATASTSASANTSAGASSSSAGTGNTGATAAPAPSTGG